LKKFSFTQFSLLVCVALFSLKNKEREKRKDNSRKRKERKETRRLRKQRSFLEKEQSRANRNKKRRETVHSQNAMLHNQEGKKEKITYSTIGLKGRKNQEVSERVEKKGEKQI
jgi:hypothetical protein